MGAFLGRNGIFLLLSLALHIVVVGGLLLGFVSTPKQQRNVTPGVKQNVIQAVAVDERKIQAEINKIKRAERQQRLKEKRRQQRLTADLKKAQQQRKKEQRKIAALKKKQQQQQAALKKQQQLQKKKLAALKKKKAQEQANIKKLKAQADKIAKQKAAQKKKLAALKKAEAKKKAADKLKRDQLAKQRALQAQMEAEEKAELKKELSGALLSYKESIAAAVHNNWRRLSKGKTDAHCRVHVKQIPGGEIISYRVSQCTGDKFFKRSVEKALEKTKILPPPKDPRVFDRDIVFTFREK